MDDSKVLGVSLRGWLALLMVATTCLMSYYAKEIKEPLYSLVLLSVGFYFGQKLPAKNGV